MKLEPHKFPYLSMRFILLVIFSWICFNTQAQDTIAQKMNWYKDAKSTSDLFVHFDKNIYSNNETVYFTGYLLKGDGVTVTKHHVLSVALVRDADSTVIQHGKFLMDNGIAFGNILLLDSILTGNYHFIAYTDRLVNGLPETVFVQPVTLKTSIDPFFKASMKLMDEGNKSTIKKVLISVTSKESRFLPKPTTISYRYGSIVKTTKTDASGQLLMSLSEQKNSKDPNLYVKLKYDNDSSFISMAIPNLKNKASVKFYPEGGNLIAGLASTIGWEVKDQQQMPVSLKALLYKDNEVIDTIETGSYGIGKFRLLPIDKSIYTLKLVHSGLADSIYTLPKVLPGGLVMNIPKAVAYDTLRIILKTNSTKNLTIRIHDFQKCYLRVPFLMGSPNQIIRIPLTDIPKGLKSVTITDSLDRPLAERLFFAHYNQQDQINIVSDKDIYNQREKISFKVKLTNPKHSGLVSIACVQNNRLDLRKTQDIASFTYLTSELNVLPTNLKGNPLADSDYVEQILLVKGWRKYNWQELEQISGKTLKPKLIDSLIISGYVTHPRKKLMKTDLVTMGGSNFTFLTTDSNGHFNLNVRQLITPSGNKLHLLFDHLDKSTVTISDYKIKINDPYLAMNAKLGWLFDPEIAVLPSLLQNNQSLVLKNNERAIQLKEVLINPNGDNSMTYNACGDYVCVFNILNCPNHPKGFKGNKPPISGNYYLFQGVKTRYEGCNKLDESIFFRVNPVYLSKEFYVNDFHDPLEPAFVSTLYWNYGTILSGQKETELNFYTSDITGRFRLVIQGILNNDVVYAEKYFEVKAKQ